MGIPLFFAFIHDISNVLGALAAAAGGALHSCLCHIVGQSFVRMWQSGKRVKRKCELWWERRRRSNKANDTHQQQEKDIESAPQDVKVS